MTLGKTKFSLLIIFLILIFGCGGAELNEGEGYGNLLNTEEGLVLTQTEHEIGWGNSECTICHNLENIHLVNRTGIPIDIDSIYDQAISGGVSSCAACHGTNGAP